MVRGNSKSNHLGAQGAFIIHNNQRYHNEHGTDSLCLTAVEPDSLIAFLWHFCHFYYSTACNGRILLRGSRLNYYANITSIGEAWKVPKNRDQGIGLYNINWRSVTSAREPRSGNRAQGLCEKTNRRRVCLDFVSISQAWPAFL